MAGVDECLIKAYEKKQTEAETAIDAEKNANVKTGDPTAGEALIQKIQGVYKKRLKNGTVSGDHFVSEDVLELVRISKTAIYFKAAAAPDQIPASDLEIQRISERPKGLPKTLTNRGVKII